MDGYIDLHCHFVTAIDDGARTVDEGLGILRGLLELGFGTVVATPHMRPGLFDNKKEDLTAAFSRTTADLPQTLALPKLCLSSEHYFDDVVFDRLMNDQGLPYPGGKAVLLEFYENDFPTSVEYRLFDLRRRGLLPVIAHPERYRSIWQKPEKLERLLELGAVALLDTAALVGKYGRRARRCAEKLLDAGMYHAACSDAHRPEDVSQVAAGMRLIEKRYGAEELAQLYRIGPREILAGQVEP